MLVEIQALVDESQLGNPRRVAVGLEQNRLAMLLAFIVPGYVAALGWLNAYGPGGLLDDLFDVAAPALVGPLGIVVVMGVEAAPIAYLIVVAGLRSRAEPDLERAARASGASAIDALRSKALALHQEHGPVRMPIPEQTLCDARAWAAHGDDESLERVGHLVQQRLDIAAWNGGHGSQRTLDIHAAVSVSVAFFQVVMRS